MHTGWRTKYLFFHSSLAATERRSSVPSHSVSLSRGVACFGAAFPKREPRLICCDTRLISLATTVALWLVQGPNAERTREQHQVLERMRTRHSFDAQELPTFRSQRSPSIFSSSADSPSAPRALLLRNACKYPYMQSIMHVCICVWCILYVVTGAFEVRRFTPTSIAARAEATRRTWLCVELRCS